VVQALMNFCSEDLGAFYLDILKDRLYTAAENSRARRSAQSALWHILQTVTRLMAPVLSFTAEEIWATLKQGDSVMLATWHVLPEQAEESALATRWQAIRAVRADVARTLEELRSAGKIGSSLQAEVTLSADAASYDLLASLGDDLKFVLICSKVTLEKLGAGETASGVASKPSPAPTPSARAAGTGARTSAGCGTSRTLRTLHLEPVRRRRGARDCLGWHAGWGWLHWWCCSTRPARPGCWRAFATWKALW
jgi:isoleucyl-tRNA synthetase